MASADFVIRPAADPWECAKITVSGPIHIVLTFDDNFWAPAFAVARSICLCTTRRDLVFHLLHDGLKPERMPDFENLRQEFGITVNHYELSQNARFNEVCRNLPVDNRLHTVMYARLLIDAILPAGVQRAIYLDCDTFAVSPIETLFEQDMQGRPVAGVSDPIRQLNMLGRDIRTKTGIFDPAQDYFNSGVMLIDVPKYAAANIPARIEEFKARGILEKLYFDQDMLNLIFKDNWTKLPWRFNVTDPQVAHQAMDPYILHYTGRARPWLIYANVAYRRSYRHVMTNELFYRYMRHRWKRFWLKRWNKLIGKR